ncbi:MAG: outer membrane lipoprotein carrier protein LolA [Chthoniobacterales bacterium]
MKYFLIFFFCPLLLMAQELSPADADIFLAQLTRERSAIPGVEKSFHEQKQMALLSHPVTAEGTIAFQPPDQFRREVSGENTSITVSNGETLWIYYPAMKEAEKYNLKAKGPVRDSIAAMVTSLNFKDLKRNFKYRIQKLNAGWEITLEPKSSALRRIFQQMHITLDKQRRVSQLDLTAENGDKTSISFHDEKEKRFPADYFSFTPPKDVNISNPLGN